MKLTARSIFILPFPTKRPAGQPVTPHYAPADRGKIPARGNPVLPHGEHPPAVGHFISPCSSVGKSDSHDAGSSPAKGAAFVASNAVKRLGCPERQRRRNLPTM